MERNNRKVLVGKVVSNKEDKTIKVSISTYRRHPLYGKRVEHTSKFTAHDENNEANIGDTVKIMETRPLSKTKNFRLLEILERGNNA
jgi:small subunit ribosomal protein S17